MALQGRGGPGAVYVKPTSTPRPTPTRIGPPPHPSGHSVLMAALAGEPFAGAQHEAQRHVEHAQQALPKAPTPHIPRLANPSPVQARTALRMALASQRQNLGAAPSSAQIRGYQQELRNDPRQREYLATLEHYAQVLSPTGAPREPLKTAGAAPGPKPEGTLGKIASILAAALAVQASTPTVKALEETGVRKGLALGDALATHPVGTVRNTATSIPQILNGLVTGSARLGLEATAEGKPGAAAEQFVKGITSDIGRRYGGLSKPGGVEADAARIAREGAAPELLDASLVFGGPSAVIGRAVSKGVEATGFGAEELAALQRLREGTRQAVQAEHPASVVPRTLSRGERAKAFVNEATQPRPNLRVAGGSERPSVSPGAAVKPQERSPNFFRAAGQTALDNARRAHTLKGLQTIDQIRKQLEDHPNAAAFAKTPKAPAPLAHDVQAGEVAPLIQGGGRFQFPGAAFFGSGKEQRVGTSYLKNAAVEQRRAEATVLQQQFEHLLGQATPEQHALFVHAKEGTLPLHDPQAATAALREIHAQALEGSRDAAGRSAIPLMDRLRGSDVAARTGKVLAQIDKHGAESVFTPQFEELARLIPDERLTAARDPSLSQDALQSRRYRPQMEHLQRWAARHPDDPLARQTVHVTDQIKQLESEGGDLRAGRAGADLSAEARHAAAADKYATAKNLADELAKSHGLPTDRAYVEHTKRFTESNAIHTIGSRAPAVVHQMEGKLAAAGYRSTDAKLILNGMLKNIRNDYKTKFLKPFDERFNVAPKGLTAHEATEWLQKSGRDPRAFGVAHLGKLRSSIAEDLAMEHAPHFNLDAQAHAAHHANLLEAALGKNIPRSDATKGAGVYPIAALNELRGVFATPGPVGRIFGKLKSATSSLMLGTSLPWLATMSGVTYPAQSLYGGAGLVALRESHSWYRGFSAADKRAVDRWFGIDSPFEQSSHGITSERLGSQAPKAFQELTRVMSAAKQFPLVKQLAANRPDHLILRMERVPRRYARINVAYKGVKTQALREMLRATKGAMAEQSRLQLGLARLEHFGRKPAAEWLDAAMKNQKFVEAHAVHLDNVLGSWKAMTQFERNIVSRGVLFYPWLRYSVKLAAKTLPRDHPLSYALALKYGTIQHEYLKELLGTDPTVGNVYLGPEQPGTAPEKRKFGVVGIRSANPLLNTVADLLGAESPAQVLGTLPPYVVDVLEYAAGKNFFTDKGLKGADKGETTYAPGKRPNLLNFIENRATTTLSPGRVALRALAEGQPQSDESTPWDLKPVRYAPATTNKIRREREELGTTPESSLLSELAPLLPHSDEGRIAGKVRTEQKQAKEQQHKERKEHLAVRDRHAAQADSAVQELRQLAKAPHSEADAAAEELRKIVSGH